MAPNPPLGQFRWARGVTDDSATATQANNANGAAPNPFSRFYTSLSGAVPLRSNDRSNEEEAYFALSRWERYDHCFFGGEVGAGEWV